jgi:hypothetical protein
MFPKSNCIIALFSVMCLSTTMISTACGLSPDAIDALNGALSALESNKDLTERFVREVKSVNLSGPEYQDVRESYESARDSYNAVIDALESMVTKKHSKAPLEKLAQTAQTASADFLQNATRALNPTSSMRNVDLRRAIKLPLDVTPKLRELPSKYGQKVFDQYDRQIRWRPWRDLQACTVTPCDAN